MTDRFRTVPRSDGEAIKIYNATTTLSEGFKNPVPVNGALPAKKTTFRRSSPPQEYVCTSSVFVRKLVRNFLGMMLHECRGNISELLQGGV